MFTKFLEPAKPQLQQKAYPQNNVGMPFVVAIAENNIDFQYVSK